MTSERDVSGPQRPIGLAVVGAGYWGPNLVRNFAGSPHYRLNWLCDIDKSRAVSGCRWPSSNGPTAPERRRRVA